jgi:hypothetical protein
MLQMVAIPKNQQMRMVPFIVMGKEGTSNNCMWINPLKPSGNYVLPALAASNSAFCLQNVFMASV